ncbi:non-homologous end-joining factor 1 isoform X1 [Manacus candei]|uniref:non-homologous end-joining factor 1 isoform X1 n=1 Tax=Manacus candei TaxID=415023 RepID=UPI002225CC5D|nr:non-homologous end-joining factor 1 isoform X1 [Manacus candei]
MEVSEELESSLLTQPWASVHFGESAFLAKVCFKDTGYILLISDLSSVWYESADTKAVGQRSKELNKRLTVNVSSFLNHLCNLMCPLLAGQPAPATTFSCNRSASGLILHVKSELSGLPFYWDFHCCPAPLEMVSRHLVRPLIRMNLALQHQVQELISLVLQKDAEIEDYRESGATLSRDRLRTEPFQEETFQQNFMTERTMQTWCPLQKSQGTPIHLLHPRRMKQHLTEREPRQPAPQLRNLGCLQPRPSQRRQRGSSAERFLPPLPDGLCSPQHPRKGVQGTHASSASSPASPGEPCARSWSPPKVPPAEEMELLSSRVPLKTAFLPWCRACPGFFSWQSQCWTLGKWEGCCQWVWDSQVSGRAVGFDCCHVGFQ